MGKKEIIISIIIVVSLLTVTYIAYKTSNLQNQSFSKTSNEAVFNKNSFTYFYGATCPHCKELGKWMQENNIEKKVKFTKLEVFYNKQNAKLMQKAADICEIPSSAVGVPFFYDRGKCYIGTDQAKDLLTKKANQKKKSKQTTNNLQKSSTQSAR